MRAFLLISILIFLVLLWIVVIQLLRHHLLLLAGGWLIGFTLVLLFLRLTRPPRR